MPRNTKISRVRWTEAEKRRLLDIRANNPDAHWAEVAESFPGRTASALCKQWSDRKIKRERDAEEMANNHDEAIPDDDQATNHDETTNTTQVSRENKRSLDVEEDDETRPRKQAKTGDVAANNDHDPPYCPSESEGGDINYKGDMARSPTARQLRSTPRKQPNDITSEGSASTTLRRPSKIAKLHSTAQGRARNSLSTTPASPDPRPVQKVKKSRRPAKTASVSSPHPTLPSSRSPEKATETNRTNASSGIASPVQSTRPSLSPSINRHSAQKTHPTTNGHSPSKPEQQMAPRPPSPPPDATTAPMEAGNNGYLSMEQGSHLLMQAAFAMRDYPNEHARATQLEENNANLLKELEELKDFIAEKEKKEAEWKKEIGELKVRNGNLEEAIAKQADQVKKLEQMSKKKNQGALDSANGATNTDCEHCLGHISRLNALAEENGRMKQSVKFLAEEWAAGNDQA